MSDSPKIPITVLGGWLGAGKTTMVNRILESTTEPIAVIVNDVGEVNVDADLIRQNAGDDDGVIELTNGCICCKIGDDLFATLADLARRSPAPHRIVLEASGVADLRPLESFLDHPRVEIDAVIALVDPANFAHRSSGPPYGSLMRAQLAGADLVIATKLDLIAKDEQATALDALREFTKARIIEASDDPAWINTVLLGAHDNPDHELSTNASAPVATITWRSDGPVDALSVKSVLQKSGLLRAKGSVAAHDGAKVIHLAGGRVTMTDLDADLEPIHAIVLIGESFDEVEAVAGMLGEL